MTYREAHVADIEQLVQVRLSVRENVLSDPRRITVQDYEEYLTVRGKGWVCETARLIAGFAVVDVKAHNIWALFVRPAWERKGIGKSLQKHMLDWYFSQTAKPVWLSTAQHSHAESFYRKSGWRETGHQPNGELRFEMTLEKWNQQRGLNFLKSP
jgi:GNAT superfamily N-acetyltransferase